MLEQDGNVGGARVPVHRHDGEQHQHRAGERVEKELEARIDAPRPTPDADDEEHRNQPALEEQIEQHQVERGEGAHHQRLEHQEGDHVFPHAPLDRLPAGDDADRHQAGGQDHERQRDPVDSHVITDRAAEPGRLFLELEIRRGRIESPDQDQRHREGDQRRPQRRPARVAGDDIVLAPQRGDDQGTDQRQHRDDEQDRPARHGCNPPRSMNQVTRAATPISMANA